MIYQQLFDRVAEPATVRAGVIGCGEFGSTIITQARTVPRLSVPVVADIDVDRARSVLLRAGVADADVAVCEDRARALAALELGKSVGVEDALLMMDLPLDVITTATRSPSAGALYASEAIRHGKHVVMVDKEADSVVGPILKHLADRAGVVFTTDDGDEPGLLMGLVSWARALGFEVLCGGNTHECLYDPVSHTVQDRGITVTVGADDRWAMEQIRAGDAPRVIAARRRLFDAFRPYEECGDPMCHLAVAANGTGLTPDTPVGHRSVVRWTELPEAFCPEESGGVLGTRGAVDMPNILRQKGDPRARNGVYIVVANADEHSREVMIRKGLHANGDRTAMLIYRPYHLCGAETAVSILCAGLLGVATGSADVRPRVDITARATRDFQAGELLSNSGASGHDRDFRAALVAGSPLIGSGPIPFFMLEGSRLRADVPSGTLFTLDALQRPADSALWRLRGEQDARFYTSRAG